MSLVEQEESHQQANLSLPESIPEQPADVADVELAPGHVLAGRYEIEALVGSGGMGLVYRARQLALGGRFVAIKHINPAAFYPADLHHALATLKNEALVMASLRHPNLLSVYDWVEDDEQVFLVMEYVEGQTLQQYIETSGNRMSFEKLVGFASQICQVLTHLHAQSPPILYRDLKPSNLMVDPQGQLRLIDFGVARCFDDYQALERVEGTPGFASPEQLRVISSMPDIRSEVYSLGATLYYMATGKIPTDARNRVTEERLPPVSRSRHDLPIRFQGLLKRAMKLNPDQRFQTVDLFHDALLQVQFEVNARETKRLLPFPNLAADLEQAVAPPPVTMLPSTAPVAIVRPPSAIDRMKTMIGTARQTLAQLTSRHKALSLPNDDEGVEAYIQDWMGRPEPLVLTGYRDGLLTLVCPTRSQLKFPLKVRFLLPGDRRAIERLFTHAATVPQSNPPAWVFNVRDMPHDVREALANMFSPASPADERRRRPRWQTRFQVFSPDLYGQRAVAVDVNQQGVCIHAPYAMPAGLVLPLSLHFDEATLDPITVQGHLRWCEMQQRGGAHLGFQFMEVPDEAQHSLAQYEAQLTGPVAIRL